MQEILTPIFLQTQRQPKSPITYIECVMKHSLRNSVSFRISENSDIYRYVVIDGNVQIAEFTEEDMLKELANIIPRTASISLRCKDKSRYQYSKEKADTWTCFSHG